jgi:single-strand DNA-binding protein
LLGRLRGSFLLVGIKSVPPFQETSTKEDQMNSWHGIGNLGAAPVLRQTASGRSVTNLSIACDRVFTDEQGNRVQRTEWVPVVVWGAQAESCVRYLDKGSLVAIDGELRDRQVTDEQGNIRTVLEVHALPRGVRFLKGTRQQTEQVTVE